jgi:hypothetical protein
LQQTYLSCSTIIFIFATENKPHIVDWKTHQIKNNSETIFAVNGVPQCQKLFRDSGLQTQQDSQILLYGVLLYLRMRLFILLTAYKYVIQLMDSLKVSDNASQAVILTAVNFEYPRDVFSIPIINFNKIL